jgi:peptide/nickel transport system substrate-binding protein
MVETLTRRAFGQSVAAATALAGYGAPARAASEQKTLRFVAQSDLRVLDPIWTTAYITRNHGYMVFDSLFALDANFTPHPQMVGDYTVSEDKLVYDFTLRDGLLFHDGSPVSGIDCVASLKRWIARDSMGGTLAAVIDEMKPGASKGFSIKLKEPFALLIPALSKVSSIVPHIMPERLANTDPYTQVTEMIGSGPFKFVKEEFEPGNKVVYVKNADYVPRQEPPSWASGGKVVKVDRVEWLYVPDHATAAAALNAGEVDWWENPPLELVPVLAANPDIAIASADPLGVMTMVRFNHLNPPFDNPKMRQALMAVADQRDFMQTLAGDAENWQVCPSLFTCGTPMSNETDAEKLTGPRDFAKAKQLIAEAGYKGEKIVVLDAVDQPNPHAQAVVAADLLKKLGLNVEMVSADWGTVVTRRASKKPIDEGGWSIFGTGTVGADMLDPTGNNGLRSSGDTAWFGWPKDEQIEALRLQWMKATDLETRKHIAVELQKRAFETVPYIPTGMYRPKTAYRKTITGVIHAPAILMWNVEKA